MNKNTQGGKEEDFLSDIFDKVGSNIDTDGGNPLQAVGNLMQSGVFTDIVTSMSSGLESGELDLSKLMGSMTGMVTNINTMAENDGKQQPQEMQEMLGQMTAMMGNLTKMTQETTEVSDGDMERGSQFAEKMIESQFANRSDGVNSVISNEKQENRIEVLSDESMIEVVDETVHGECCSSNCHLEPDDVD